MTEITLEPNEKILNQEIVKEVAFAEGWVKALRAEATTIDRWPDTTRKVYKVYKVTEMGRNDEIATVKVTEVWASAYKRRHVALDLAVNGLHMDPETATFIGELLVEVGGEAT